MSVNLFAGGKADVYAKSEIYDPDIHTTDALANGKVVPAVGSLITEIVGADLTLWAVVSVHPTTYKATLSSPKLVSDGITGSDRFMSYGNDTLLLFFDDRSTPTRLIVDSKFVVLGSNSAEYRVYAVRNGQEVVLSTRLNNLGEVISDRIPLTDSGVPGIKKFNDCHCLLPIVNGELCVVRIYDTAGVLTTEVRMIARRSDILNDLLSDNNPIVDFDARVDQSEGDFWVLYTNQPKEELTIFPEITYADGNKELVAINNTNTFIFGMEDISTAVADVVYPVMIKHFITNDTPALNSEGTTERFLIVEKNLKIKQRSSFKYSKISVFPRWDVTLERYVLTFYGYYELRNRFDVLSPSAVSFLGTAFDGNLYTSDNNPIQNLNLRANVVDNNGSVVTYQQQVSIRLFDPNTATPYLISSTPGSSFVYGDNTGNHRRPAIRYDIVRQKYFIPTSLFSGTNLEPVDAFLDNFYYRAEPPFLPPAETLPPEPTHFTIRNASGGQVLLATPVAVPLFAQQMAFITSGGSNQYNNSSVIVEFLKFDGATYKILYGVPVAITTGIYNT